MKRFWLKAAIIIGVWSALATILAISQYLRALSRGQHLAFGEILFAALLDYWIWAALTPAVLWFAANFPFTRGRILRSIATHSGLYVLASLAHVTLAQLLRVDMIVPKGFHGPVIVLRFLQQFYSDLWMYVPIVGIWNLLDYYRKFRERELRAAQLEGQLATVQLQLLKTQIHPHFLFNTLNSISALMQDDTEAAEQMIADLSYMLRAALHSGGTQEISLGEEIELLQTYLRIQKRRFEDRLSFHIHVPAELQKVAVPTLLLQPLVENAIRHGIAPQSRRGMLRVQASGCDDKLVITVSDDGCGLPPDYREGIGLSNTKARLRQLYGEQQAMVLSSQPGHGVEITLSLPLRFMPQAGRNYDDENSDAGSGRRAVGAQADPVAAEIGRRD